MSSGENVMFFDALFIILLAAFGFSTNNGAGFNALQTIPSPTLAPLPNAAKCAFWDFVCNGINSNAIAQATAYIGWAIVNGPVLFIYFIIVIITFANIILSIAFGSNLGVKGVPVFGLIFFALQVYVIFEAVRLFRGNSTAGV